MANSQELEAMIRITKAHVEGLRAIGATDEAAIEAIRLADFRHNRSHFRLSLNEDVENSTAAPK
ncbi:MAG: hypothetical protein NTY30_01370 [Candidatus Berkelbacteria bacterium]|nr:hypothetical protein [Candidatus Berkelbacteria bacterium]